MPKEALTDLAARAAAVREYAHTLPGGVVVRLRLPTSFDMQVESRRTQFDTGADPAALLVLKRRLLLAGTFGWTGVLQNHLATDASPEPLDFDPAAVAPLLDAQPDWEADLGNELIRRLADRVAVRDAAAKN